jgi:hypothetical protein
MASTLTIECIGYFTPDAIDIWRYASHTTINPLKNSISNCEHPNEITDGANENKFHKETHTPACQCKDRADKHNSPNFGPHSWSQKIKSSTH